MPATPVRQEHRLPPKTEGGGQTTSSPCPPSEESPVLCDDEIAKMRDLLMTNMREARDSEKLAQILHEAACGTRQE